MPRYFFNTDNHERDEDLEGTELAGPDAARVAAVMFAGEYLRDNPELVWDGRRFSVDVQDETRRPLLKITVEAEAPAAD